MMIKRFASAGASRAPDESARYMTTPAAIILACLVGGAIFLITALAFVWLALVPAITAALTTGVMVRSILGERSMITVVRIGLCVLAVVCGVIVGAVALIITLGFLLIVK